jgi:hypothetical protein
MTPLTETCELASRFDAQLVEASDEIGSKFFRQSEHR